MDISEISKPWYDKWKDGVTSAAPEEAARRYYSVKNLLVNQLRNNMYYQCSQIIEDNKFFDHMMLNQNPNFLNNDWILHSSKPLQKSIQKYAKFPIATTYDNKNGQEQCLQPRLLIFSVDVAEGVTVTFDSYPNPDGPRRSEYGEYDEKKGYQIVIRYDHGINIEHVMASGTIPEFYSYAQVLTTEHERSDENEACTPNKSKNKNIRYFWDGGWLSNTPLRELLEAHRQYWTNDKDKGKIPDLEVYIVNLNPQKMNINNLPEDHDGVKDRSNDILFGDRSSHYDESVAHLITDYANFCTLLKETVSEAIRQVNDENKQQNLEKKLQTILTAKTISKDNKNRSRVYRDLMSEGFDLQIAMRIERTNYTNSIFNKTGDLTFETINKLIKEGKCDALFSVIRRRINNMKIDDYKKRILISELDLVWQKLKEKDYEDNDSYVYHLLTDFIENIKGKQKLESYQSATIVNPVKELLAILN